MKDIKQFMNEKYLVTRYKMFRVFMMGLSAGAVLSVIYMIGAYVI